MDDKPLAVESFNREIDRVTRRGEAIHDEWAPEDQKILLLAQRLASADYSENSTIRQSLRQRLAERSFSQPFHENAIRRLVRGRDGRTLTGAGVAILLVFILFFGVLTPQSVSATPAYVHALGSPNGSGMPSASLTIVTSHNTYLAPKPVPTPGAASAIPGQPAPLTRAPGGTPARANLPMGSQFPIVTTTVSK